MNKNLKEDIKNLKNFLKDKKFQQAIELRQNIFQKKDNYKITTLQQSYIDIPIIKYLQKYPETIKTEEELYSTIFSYIHYYIFEKYVDDIHQIWKSIYQELNNKKNTQLIDKLIQNYEIEYKKNPKNIQNLFCWGTSLQNLNKLDEGISKFKEILEIDPQNSEAYRAWGDCHENREEHEKSVEKLQIACQLDPKNESAFHNLGYTYSKMKKYDLAVQNLKISLSINPNDYLTYYNLAKCYEEMGKTEECQNTFQLALKFNPENKHFYEECGDFFYEQQQYQKAFNIYKKGLELDPNNDDMLNNCGVSLQHLKKNEEALDYFKKALTINDKIYSYYINIGNSLIDMDQPEKAYEILKQALSKDIEDKYNNLAELYTVLGRSCYVQNQFNESIDHYQSAIELDRNNTQFIKDLSEIFYELENYEACEQTILRLLELEPQKISHLCYRGIMILKQNRFEEGLEYFKNLNEKYPNNNQVLDGLATSYYNKHQYLQAIDIYQEALKVVTLAKENWEEEEPYDVVLQRQFEEFVDCLEKHQALGNNINKYLKQALLKAPRINVVLIPYLQGQLELSQNQDLIEFQEEYILIVKNPKILIKKCQKIFKELKEIPQTQQNTIKRLKYEIKQFKQMNIKKNYRKEIIQEIIDYNKYKSEKYVCSLDEQQSQDQEEDEELSDNQENYDNQLQLQQEIQNHFDDVD